MGLVYAEVELINGGDLEMVRRGYMDKDEVKRMHVNILVDSGSITLAINENIQEILHLPILERKTVQLANGNRVECDMVGPVEIKFKNRNSSCRAMVLPGDSEPLLGVIPMEEMDVLIDPLRQELIVNPDHPDFAVLRL